MCCKCLICGEETEYYFKKKFDLKTLPSAEYYRCKNCGFVFSKTHYEMDESDWEQLNAEVHKDFYAEKLIYEHQPPFLEQALFFHILAINKVIKENMWLDYGAGLGRLSSILREYFGKSMYSYDKYINPVNNPSDTIVDISFLKGHKFDLVFSSAVLEHIRNLDPIEEMLSYLSDGGACAFHTLVCENIPKDPAWFYLFPVHCSFFTNRSMAILMEKYNMHYSIYSPFSKTWLLMKNKPAFIDLVLKHINNSFLLNYLYGKCGFFDYWK